MGSPSAGAAVYASRSRRRLSPEERREAITAAACQLALREGLQNLTHRNIAAQLGVTHALVVHYEPDIEQLRTRIYEVLLQQELDDVRSMVDQHTGSLPKLVELIRLMSRPGREEFAGVWLDGWSIGRRHEQTAAVVRTMMDRWQDMVSRILNHGIADREFTLSDPDDCAWEIIALLDGFNAHTIVGYRNLGHYRMRIAAPIEARLSLQPGTLLGTAPTGQTDSANSSQSGQEKP